MEKITKKVIKILKLDYVDEQPILIGDANIKHIKDQHPNDFKKYILKIEEIIKKPTYLARNQKKKSIEFIKKYEIEKYFKHKYFYKF